MPSSRSEHKGFWDYQAPTHIKMTPPERVVHFILWSAIHHPGRPVSVPHMVRVAYNLPKLPKEEAKDVISFGKKIGAVRKILYERHKKALISHPGLGFRASVDDADAARNDTERKAKRVVHAINGLDKSRHIVNRSNLSGALRERFDELGEVTKRLTSSNIYDKLLPPNTEKDKGDKKDDKKN